MVPVKVRKKDSELGLIAPSIRSIVDIAEKIVVENAGSGFALKHRVNLYIGEKQRFANNPRSRKMYIQYRGIDKDDADSGAEPKNLYISGILHETGHSYLKIENSLRRAKESIASEGLANVFGLLLMDEVCARMDATSWLLKNNYPDREKRWYADLFKGKKALPCPLEAARFFYGRVGRKELFEMIKLFQLKHKTYAQFEGILESVLGEKNRNDYAKLVGSFDLEEYASRYDKKA